MSEGVFTVDHFDFLLNLVPYKQGIGLSFRGADLTITCFDINSTLILFGTNSGAIYGFSRGEKASRNPHFTEKFISTCIVCLKLVNSDVVAVAAGPQVFLRDLQQRNTIYQWTSPSFGVITAMDLILKENLSQLALLTGDRLGEVWMHKIHDGKQSLIFKESKKTNDAHNHEVVQISCNSGEFIIISTCHRSCIVKIKGSLDEYEVVQIGKNTRKTCGRYGAICYNNLIYAARPSVHLIKASETDGSVLETFILKKAKDPQPLELMFVKQNRDKPPPPQLGLLTPIVLTEIGLCLVSWSEQSVFLVTAAGRLLIKELDLTPILDVRVCANDVFLLFQNRKFVRVRYDELHTDAVENPPRKDSTTEEDRFAPFVPSLFTPVVPMAYQALSHIKKLIPVIDTNGIEEKKEFSPTDAPQDDVAPANNDASCSSDGESTRTPLVVRQKVKKNKRKSKRRSKLSPQCESDSQSGSGSRKGSLLNDDMSVSSSSSSNRPRSPLPIKDNEVPQVSSINGKSNLAELENDDYETRLFNYLTNHKKQMENNVADVDANFNSKENTVSTADVQIETIPNTATPQPDESTANTTISAPLASSETPKIVPINQTSTSKKPNVRVRSGSRPLVDINWNLILESSSAVNNLKVKSLCASSYDDQIGVGLVWLCCQTEKSSQLYYLPSFKSMKPASKSTVLSLAASITHVIVAHADGGIFRKEGDGMKLINSKWIPVNTDRVQCKILNISLNTSNNVCWCCDEVGNAWLLKLRTNVLWPVRNGHLVAPHFKCISVAPQDSGVVWGMDFMGDLYVRTGIFNDNEDDDGLIAGVIWLKVDVPVKAWSVTVTPSSVWVLDLDGSRIFRRIGMTPPVDCVGFGWEEVRCPTLVNDRIKQLSASLNNDVWLLTDFGLVWQYCQHPARSLEEIDAEWILVS